MFVKCINNFLSLIKSKELLNRLQKSIHIEGIIEPLAIGRVNSVQTIQC